MKNEKFLGTINGQKFESAESLLQALLKCDSIDSLNITYSSSEIDCDCDCCDGDCKECCCDCCDEPKTERELTDCDLKAYCDKFVLAHFDLKELTGVVLEDDELIDDLDRTLTKQLKKLKTSGFNFAKYGKSLLSAIEKEREYIRSVYNENNERIEKLAKDMELLYSRKDAMDIIFRYYDDCKDLI